ncbi:MAG: hydrogenase [Haliea sp.]|nr:hydrogenase [Haliea sp.]
MSAQERKAVLWDWPTRLFHWGVVICLPLAWWTAEEGQMNRHKWLGYTVLVLVVFRIFWGFLGSRHSRFADFLRGPRTVWAWLRGPAPDAPGHNPLGGWSVLVLLVLLLAQSVSGLFNTDDILFRGPFHYAASTELQGFMGELHEWAFDALLVMIALHLAAVAWHQWGRGEPLIQAMLRGRSEGRSGLQAPVPAWRALVLLALVGGALATAVALAPQPPRLW